MRFLRVLSMLLPALGCSTVILGSTVRLVDDIGDHLPISAGSHPFALAAAGDYVTFLARPSDHSGVRLYSSDGTTDGTRELVLGSLVGSADTGLFLGGFDGVALYELRTQTAAFLYATDGSQEEPRLLRRELAASIPFQPGTDHASSVLLDGALLYFMSYTGSSGSLDLWRTAGTASTTWRVTSLPYSVGTLERGPVASREGVAFFVVSESWLSSRALWRSDGTSGGTFELLSLSADCYVDDLAALDTKALFVASCDGVSTLWSSDGTPTGTIQLADITGVLWHSAFEMLATDGHSAFFTKASGEHPLEVWLSRGDPESTRLVAWIDDYSETEYANGIAPYTAVLGEKALLGVVDAERRLDLWSVDVASGATAEIATVGGEGHYLVDGTSGGGRAWLAVVEPSGYSTVWTSDGTSSGTIRLFHAEVADAWDDLRLATPEGSGILFTYRTGNIPTLELWSTDGTPAGTRLLTSELSRAWRGFGFSPPAARDLATVGPATFFAGADPYFGWELWRAGSGDAMRVADLRLDRAGIDWLEVLGEIHDELVVAATDLFDDRWEIWATSLEGGTSRLLFERPFDCSRHGCNVPRSVYEVGERAVYLEWGSDVAPSVALGFDPTTGEVEDLFAPGASPTGDEAQPSLGELVLLGTSDGATAIFATDGTHERTRRLISFPGAYTYSYSSLGRVGERWILWESHWPAQRILAFDLGTRQLETLIEDERLRLAQWVLTRDGLALDLDLEPSPGGLPGREVWWTDGTATGTRRAFQPAGYSLSRLAADSASSTFLFSSYDYATGASELWISDGSPERSRRIVAELGSSLALDGPVIGFRGLLLFALTAQRDFIERRELWRSDGSVEGTFGLYSTPYYESGTYLWTLEPTALGEHLLFIGRDPEHGVELWETDGTVAGTGLLDDLEPGPASSKPEDLARFGDRLIFTAAAAGLGRELWSAGEAQDSAELVTDLFPGEDSSTPNVLEAIGDHLLFLGDDGVVGRELWSLDGAERDPCAPSRSALCLAGERLRITASWRKFDGVLGEATAVPLTPDSGYFWFFDPDNPELLVKALDACSVPETQSFWTFASGLTDVAVALAIQDTRTGETRRIETGLGEEFRPVFDASSFRLCEGGSSQRPAATGVETALGPVLPLLGGRFEAEVRWSYPGASGAGEAVALSDQAGYFWFFDPGNVELLVKVLDGCAFPAHPAYWVFAGGLTDLEVELRLRDLFTGQVYRVATAAGRPFPPVLDTGAFPTCP